MSEAVKRKLSCSDCRAYHCDRRKSKYPEFCLTVNTPETRLEEIKSMYMEDPFTSKVLHTASEVVGGSNYGKLTRVEETVLFAKELGAKKIGIATCIGLINEANTFVRILEAKGFNDYCTVVCKVGSIDKTEVGIDAGNKIIKNCHESSCNPILQADILNKEKTDLNIVIGLCVGHDTLFIKHSEAPVTVLIVKDRVLANNPAAALYTTCSYYKKLLEKQTQ